MRSLARLLVVALTLLPLVLGAQQTRDDVRWRLTWSDEFTGLRGAPPDRRHWLPDTGDGCARGICGWGNGEKQFYTAARENAALTGAGQLAITVRVAPAGRRCWYGPCRYTSAKLITKGRVEPRAGRIAIRVKLPRGQGLWPAFWMLGATWPDSAWPGVGEIDVMEFKGSTPTGSSSALHGPGYSGNTPLTHWRDVPGIDLSRDFHVFAVERDSATIRFFVDEHEHLVVTRAEVERHGRWVFDAPFFLLLNLAVGGGFDGDPASDAVLPATMLVDWVRVYEHRQASRPTPRSGGVEGSPSGRGERSTRGSAPSLEMTSGS